MYNTSISLQASLGAVLTLSIQRAFKALVCPEPSHRPNPLPGPKICQVPRSNMLERVRSFFLGPGDHVSWGSEYWPLLTTQVFTGGAKSTNPVDLKWRLFVCSRYCFSSLFSLSFGRFWISINHQEKGAPFSHGPCVSNVFRIARLTRIAAPRICGTAA